MTNLNLSLSSLDRLALFAILVVTLLPLEGTRHNPPEAPPGPLGTGPDRPTDHLTLRISP